MSRLSCPCGETLHSTDEGLWRQFASFVLTPDELELLIESVRCDDDEPELRELWQCVCGRIAIDKTVEGGDVQWYVPLNPTREK